MIETPVATQLVTNATTPVSVTNESVTESTSIFERVCVKVAVSEESQLTVSLEARIKIFHTMTADELFTAICDLIRSSYIFPGIL